MSVIHFPFIFLAFAPKAFPSWLCYISQFPSVSQGLLLYSYEGVIVLSFILDKPVRFLLLDAENWSKVLVLKLQLCTHFSTSNLLLIWSHGLMVKLWTLNPQIRVQISVGRRDLSFALEIACPSSFCHLWLPPISQYCSWKQFSWFQ